MSTSLIDDGFLFIGPMKLIMRLLLRLTVLETAFETDCSGGVFGCDLAKIMSRFQDSDHRVPEFDDYLIMEFRDSTTT